MAGRIPQTFIEDLLARVNIVDVVDSRVKLKKAGKNYSACCPFHNEKTPSFTVAGDKQFYYCFGCGAKGNAIGFVMDYDNIDFPEAVELLADTIGMEVPKEEVTPYQQKQQQERTNLYELMGSANEFYQQQLRFHEGKQVAVDYLKNRGLSGKAAKFFNIGYAPPGWDNLKNTMAMENGHLNEEKIKALVETGMLVEKDNGSKYDRFRNRIVFPIRDVRGRTIGFGARTLGDDKPKYLNSPETPIFNKGHELYGLYECRQIRQPLKRFLVVEGYMDVVALHEFGLHYAVATLGTATSPTHLQKLFKIAPEVIFCFDGDQAGRKAAKRGLEQALPILEDGQQIRFMFLPDGEDPDSLIRSEGKDGFEQRISHAQGISEFLLKQLKEDIDDPDSLEGRARLAKLAAPMIQEIPGIALKSLFWQSLSEATHLEVSDLKTMAEEQPKPTYSKPDVPLQQAHQASVASAAHSEPLHHYYDYDQHDYEEYGYGEEPQQAISNEPPLVKTAISLVLHAPQVVQGFGDLSFLQEFTGHNTDLLRNLIGKLNDSPQNSVLDALSLLSNDNAYQTYHQLTEHHNKREGHLEQEQAALDCLTQLRLKAAKQIKTRIIKQAAGAGGFDKLDQTSQQLFHWASHILELDLIQTKLQKAGGDITALNEADQEKYRQLTGQTG